MLGNEVTGQSVNTPGSLQSWPGGRLSHCSENGNVNKINLPAFWPLCGSTGCACLLTAGEGFGKCLENQHKKTWQHTNKQAKCLSTIFSEAQKLRNKGREVEIHSPLVCVANWSKLGELDLTSVWVTFLRKPLTVREGYGPTRVYCFRLS